MLHKSCTGKFPRDPPSLEPLPYTITCPHISRTSRDLTHRRHTRKHRKKLQHFRMHWFGDLRKRSSQRNSSHRVKENFSQNLGVWTPSPGFPQAFPMDFPRDPPSLEPLPYTITCPHISRTSRDLTHRRHTRKHRKKLQHFRMHWFGDLRKRSSQRNSSHRVKENFSQNLGVWTPSPGFPQAFPMDFPRDPPSLEPLPYTITSRVATVTIHNHLISQVNTHAAHKLHTCCTLCREPIAGPADPPVTSH